ncbi:MAG: S-layer homology domain-containing protein, partial [Bacillota bacterium]|nr:S-layer homology domain-containing protein [Bacillota bacterium]
VFGAAAADMDASTVTGLSDSTDYYFTVVVSDEAGNKSIYDTASATTKSERNVTHRPQDEDDDESIFSVIVINDEEENCNTITDLIGDSLEIEGKVSGDFDGELTLNNDGTYVLEGGKSGTYEVVIEIVLPNGDRLAGNKAILIIHEDGSSEFIVELIDPFGVINNPITGEVLSDVELGLYWADTKSNEDNGRDVDTIVELPLLPEFDPNKNMNPQKSDENGSYGWMVFPDSDYYIIGEKDGYQVYDSRLDEREIVYSDDTYMRDGIIHVGSMIVKLDFALLQEGVEIEIHNHYIEGYEDGTLQFDRLLSESEVVTILDRLSLDKRKAADRSEYEGKWYLEYANNYAGWFDDFSADNFVTRGDFVNILFNVLGLEKKNDESQFSDVNNHENLDSIMTFESNDWINGYPDGTFKPDREISRNEAVIIINNVFNHHPVEFDVLNKWMELTGINPNYAEALFDHKAYVLPNGDEYWFEILE